MKLLPEEIDRRARGIYMAMDPSISYTEAVKFVVADAEDPDGKLQFAGATPVSLDLHHRVRALIMAEKEKGNTITYLEAVRRIEKEQAKT